VVAPKPGPRLLPVSSRLKQELIHPNRTAYLTGIRFSPDGKRLIAGDYPGGMVLLWELPAGKQASAIDTGYRARSLDYFSLSPDWQTLYAPHAQSKTERLERDGKRLLQWTCKGEVRAWDLATGRLRRTFQHQPPRGIVSMRLAPDGTHFVTFEELSGVEEGAAKRAVSLWDVRAGTSRPLPDGLHWLGAFSPDGRLLSISAVDTDGYTTALKFFDAATGQQRLSIPVAAKKAWTFATTFSPDGKLVIGEHRVFEGPEKYQHWQAWLKWWETATGREVGSFALDRDESLLLSGHFSPDGQVYAATNRHRGKTRLFLFRTAGRKPRAVLLGESTKGEALVTSELAFSPDGKWLAVVALTVPEGRGGRDPDVRDLPQPRIQLIDVRQGRSAKRSSPRRASPNL
jgi:WD40 repeat protein